MAKLRKNVTVGNQTYGPDYPAEVTAEVRKALAELDVWDSPVKDSEPEPDQSDLAAEGRYDEMTHDGLQEELRRRKEAGADLKVTGKQADLIARLKDHDASQGA